MEIRLRSRILIVEDEPMIAARTRSMLESMGYRVSGILSSGEEVLDEVARLNPDLILMDISLRGRLDGVQTAEQVRIRYEIPVIFITGRADRRTLERARLAEPFGYLVKPFEKSDLYSAIIMAEHKQSLEISQREGKARFRMYPSGQLMFASTPLVEMLGYEDRDALLRQNLFDLGAEGRKAWSEESRLTHCGATAENELELCQRDGASIWVVVAYRAICDADDNIVYYEGSMTDITKWKQAEAQLRRRAAHLEALNAVITSTTVVHNTPELLQIALDHSLEALALTVGSIWLDGHSCVRGLPNDNLLSQVHQAADRLFPKSALVEDWQVDTLDPALFELAPMLSKVKFRSSLLVPIMSGDRCIGGINLGSFQRRSWGQTDITFINTLGHQLGAAVERLRLLETIREQVLQVHQIIHAVPEGVILLGTTFHIIMANPVGQEYLAALSDERVGDVLTQLGGHHLSELLTSPIPGLWHQIEVENRCFEVIARAVEPGPETAGWVLVIRDVTQRELLQQRMQRQDRLASVGQLAAGIAHDLNNLFTVINIHAQLAMTSDGTPADAQERISTVLKQGERGSNLIEQILDFSRRTDIDRSPMELTPLIKEAVKLLQHTLPENIKLSFAHGSDEYLVSADPTRIQQVLMNLAINARDAMPDGGLIEINLSRSRPNNGIDRPLPEMEPGDWVQIMVKDSGSGIPAGILPHIFDPFFTTKAPGEGTGLGLAQVHGIVEQHKGHINVESIEGEGTTFTIYLPGIVRNTPSPETTRETDLAFGNLELILVVEDDPATRDVLVDGLTSLNYQVICAENGLQALDIIDEKNDGIRLVLSDLVMPEMGGVALINALRQRSWSGSLIVLSGHPMGSVHEEGLDAEFVRAVLSKPVRLEQLAQTVHQALGVA